jgi:hypothetical protein
MRLKFEKSALLGTLMLCLGVSVAAANDCRFPHEGVIQAMEEATDSGKSSFAAAHCGKANIIRALNWKMINCDSSRLSSEQRSQMNQQLAINIKTSA